MPGDEIGTCTSGIVRCILCGHEGHEDDGETDNYGDWYCETCVEVAPSDETPIVTDGGQPIDGIEQFAGFWDCDKCGPSFAVLEEIAGPPREGRPPILANVQGTPVVRCIQCNWHNFASWGGRDV